MFTRRVARALRGPPSTDRRPGFGVTTRLIALVMLPVTVMCGLAGSVVLSHRSTASDARGVDHGVEGLSHLVDLGNALHTQQTAEDFEVRFVELSVTSATASTFLGLDLASKVAPARAQAQSAIALLGASSPVSAAALQSLYGQIDGRVISPTVGAERLSAYVALIDAAVTRGLDGLEAETNQLSLVVALQALQTTTAFVDSAAPQGIDLSLAWFPAPATTPEATAATVALLGEESADFADTTASLRDLGVASVITSLGRIDADPQVQVFNQAIADTLAGKPRPTLGAGVDTARVAATFRGYLTRANLLNGLVATATVTVRGEARDLAASERTTFLAWALAAGLLALASVGVALWLARSISEPLKDLADYAQAINEGQLDAEPSPGRDHGPRETRVAFGVFGDLVTNLRLLDAKANALAHCDFDDPALNAPLPGRLGRSLESSVAVLSGSIVQRDELQTHLAHEATHDSLTGIPNRPAAMTAIQAALHRAARAGTTVALLFVDLNDFKPVNDSHGHEVGDEVLRQVATRMTVGLRTGDFVARLGGDEFVVVAEGVAGAAEATEVARRIVEAISRPIDVGSLHVTVGAAVGIALTLDGPEDPFRLLTRADAAMYRAKQHEGSAVEIFDAELQRQMIEREDIESALAAALADPTGGGLKLHYQPVLEAATGRLVGAEALIWECQLGLAPPCSSDLAPGGNYGCCLVLRGASASRPERRPVADRARGGPPCGVATAVGAGQCAAVEAARHVPGCDGVDRFAPAHVPDWRRDVWDPVRRLSAGRARRELGHGLAGGAGPPTVCL